MTTLVITVIGEDRPGLVSALSDAVAEHGGSWVRSQLSELAGTFAGIVTVEVPPDAVEPLKGALRGLQGVLETRVRRIDEDPPRPAAEGAVAHLELVGHERPGIVRQISGVLAAAGVSVERLQTAVVPAPQAGGDLFQARALLRAPAGTDLDRLRSALEDLAQELQVDVAFGEDEQGADWG
ncbi:glycine cleavage system protein R [Ornithinimicrobium pratense]|uniref:Amino acid-binding ACT protein n=1 Tax=Ornithinimicrobium pratense TaxID=2593973 RepID=A0A5J6V5T8_9MICO|nr:ACT domain-containing protein [Ornithinimicrobium pratense]QFG69128.1 amino acid-binding ACT protein [Ornithinimicrobium pratense]